MIRKVQLDVSVASPTIPNARQASHADGRPPRSAAPSPKLSPKDKDPLDFAKYTVPVSSKKHCVPVSMSAWGSLSPSPSHMPDHLPSSLNLPAAARRKLSPTTKCDDEVDQKKAARAQLRSAMGSRQKQVGLICAARARHLRPSVMMLSVLVLYMRLDKWCVCSLKSRLSEVCRHGGRRFAKRIEPMICIEVPFRMFILIFNGARVAAKCY
jgi:hypothetical protein